MQCWGGNDYGQLGLGDSHNRGNASDQMGDDLDVVDLGDGFVVADISLGHDFTCALSLVGTLKCFGSNAFGQLGYGDTVSRGTNILDMVCNTVFFEKLCFLSRNA